MERKRAFSPGETVATFTGQAGAVLSEAEFREAQARLREGHRPGRHFAPGCCHRPDYVTQVPVLFEDGTYDVMRAMNLKKTPGLPPRSKKNIEALLARFGRP